MDEAKALLQHHLHLVWNASCSIEVHEVRPMPGMQEGRAIQVRLDTVSNYFFSFPESKYQKLHLYLTRLWR